MQLTVNGKQSEIKIASISTLIDVITQIENTLQQGHIITTITLNEKELEPNWLANASKIYLLDEDSLIIKTEESVAVARVTLENSKEQFQMLITEFKNISDSFRISDETQANTRFVQGIENLQWFLKILEDAAVLLGKPLQGLMDKEVAFTVYINELVGKLDQIITVQRQKDWVQLADMIEYEMIPALEKLGEVYKMLGV